MNWRGEGSGRKVLLIAYYFPWGQRSGIGAARPGALARYLPDFGYQPTLLTPGLSGKVPYSLPVVETGEKDLVAQWKDRLGVPRNRSLGEAPDQGGVLKGAAGRLLRPLVRGIRSVILYPDAMRGWIPDLLRTGRSLLARERFDLILATCGPESAALAARQLAGEAGLPYVLDFGDLWTEAQISRGGPLRLFFERRLERKVLGGASAVVTVSRGYAGRFRKGQPGLRVESIPTGYEPLDFQGPPPKLDAELTLTYPGRYYPGYQRPEDILEPLQDLNDEDKSLVRLQFFGSSTGFLEPMVRRLGLQGQVRFLGQIPFEESLEAQRRSRFLLLLGWHGARAEGWIPGKTFEYLGARRPILAVGGNRSDFSELIESTGAGRHIVGRAAVAEFLKQALARFRKDGQTPFEGDESRLCSLTHKEMAAGYAQILDAVLEGRRG